MVTSSQDIRFGFDCILFEACNLRCKFCLEAHENTKIDLNWIHSIPQLLVDRFKEEYKKYPNTKEIAIRMWGGELFYDTLPDTLFDEYRKLISNFKKVFKEIFPDITLIFLWVSNGVYKKTDRVLKLLHDTNSKLNISYDPIDRFKTEEQKNLMLTNAKYFNSLDLLEEISITLTKPNILEYCNDLTHLQNLQFTQKIDINYYIPNINWKTLLPSDDDLFLFFKTCLINKFYNILDLQKILNSFCFPEREKEFICGCHKHLSACKDCVTYNCVKTSSILPNEDFYGNLEISEDNVSQIKANLGKNKRGCVYCKYFIQCPRFCWTSILYKNYKTTNCPFKQLYEFLENNNNFVEEYKNAKNIK